MFWRSTILAISQSNQFVLFSNFDLLLLPRVERKKKKSERESCNVKLGVLTILVYLREIFWEKSGAKDFSGWKKRIKVNTFVGNYAFSLFVLFCFVFRCFFLFFQSGEREKFDKTIDCEWWYPWSFSFLCSLILIGRKVKSGGNCDAMAFEEKNNIKKSWKLHSKPYCLFGFLILVTQFSVFITHNLKMVGPITQYPFGKQ